MNMNRKGFLKRIAGAIGLVAVGKEVAAKAELECGYRVRYMSTEEYDEKFPRHTGIDLAEAKDFDVRCEESRYRGTVARSMEKQRERNHQVSAMMDELWRNHLNRS